MKKLILILSLALMGVFVNAQGLIDRGDKVYIDLSTIGDESIEGFYMVLVKNGYFKMGATPEQYNADEDEKPAHKVYISKDYYIGETEVTQALWEYVMGENPSKIKDSSCQLPVENITWEDAQIFCRNLSRLTKRKFRLPTEAEWEYAARGGHKAENQTLYSGSDNADEVAWTESNSNYRTHPIKSKKPNALGIYDMSGNVYEMCLDTKEKYSTKGDTQTDPLIDKGQNTKKVRRGGAWDVDNSRARVSFRRKIDYLDKKHEHEPDGTTGLRLVMEAE